MHGTLIRELNPNQRMYRLDFKVYKGVNGVKVRDIAERATRDLTSKWSFDGNMNYVDTVVVSDAHTHAERLVFPAFKFKNKDTGEVIHSHIIIQIAGQWTMKIHGGDVSSMLEPEEYFEQLYEVNKEMA